MRNSIIAILILFSTFLCSGQNAGKNGPGIKTDICILSGSEAGFTAAIQASRMGKKVVLIEPTGHPGGMMVEGIVKDIRFGSARVIGGIAREVYTAIEAYYGLEPDFQDPAWYSRYEPSVAERIIEGFLAREKNIHIIRKTRIKEAGGVKKEGNEIRRIFLENGIEISAKFFIDASIEGHLIHLAGISTETMREGNAKYGETKNGIQVNNTYRQFSVKVDPYIVPGDPTSGLLPTIQDGELGEYGARDRHIQGFCFRMCLTKREDNRIFVAKPGNYNPDVYEIYRRYLHTGGKLFQPYVNRHNGKTDIGSWHDLSANLYGENWKDWGLCRDEFVDNGHWPRRLYIRSARRMVSSYVITEHHTRRDNQKRVEGPVAIAWWPPDTHHARRIVKDGWAYNEGFVFGGDDWRPFGISFRALIPKSSECTNLVTPTCPSSSYVAYGAIRILPTFMILGQAAGCAAALALDQQVPVKQVVYKGLKEKLLESGQILEIPENWLEIITTYH